MSDSIYKYKGFQCAYHPMRKAVCLLRDGKQHYVKARFITWKEETRVWIDGFLAQEAYEQDCLTEYNEI